MKRIVRQEMVKAAQAVRHCTHPEQRADPMICPDCMWNVLTAALNALEEAESKTPR